MNGDPQGPIFSGSFFAQCLFKTVNKKDGVGEFCGRLERSLDGGKEANSAFCRHGGIPRSEVTASFTAFSDRMLHCRSGYRTTLAGIRRPM